jgi:hypothetical protein
VSVLTNYRGLEVMSPPPVADGGLAIQDNLKSLVEWQPKSVYGQTTDPSGSQDSSQDFFPGSLWLRSNVSPPKLFLCLESTPGSAVWKQVMLVGDGVPYTGANANVDLGSHRLTTVGLNAGFSQSNPNQNAQIYNYWFPRLGDLASGWSLDFQDEFAIRDKKGASITVSPVPTFGTESSLLVDDYTYIQYTGGTSPGTVVIEVDTSARPVIANGNGTYALGITFRSSSKAANPTHILIECKAPSSDYGTVFDQDVAQSAQYGAWVSPLFSPPDGQVNVAKIRVTLTVPTPLPANFRLQRIVLYHSTAPYDPWHLHVLGGSVFGNVGIGTATPVRLLHVDAGQAAATPCRISTVGAGLNHLELEDSNAGDSSRPFAYFRQDAGLFTIGNANRSGTGTTQSADRLSIDASGRVGIATSTPYSSLQVGGSFATALVVKTAAYGITASDCVLLGDATSGAITLTLPTAVGIAGRQYTVKRANGGSNAVTLATSGSQNIDGAGSIVLATQYERVTVISDGENWYII